MQVSIHEAKTQLSKLIAAVEAGEEVIIARRDTPVVKLEKLPTAIPDRSGMFGALKDYFPDEAVERLTTDKELDHQIENDFMDSIK